MKIENRKGGRKKNMDKWDADQRLCIIPQNTKHLVAARGGGSVNVMGFG